MSGRRSRRIALAKRRFPEPECGEEASVAGKSSDRPQGPPDGIDPPDNSLDHYPKLIENENKSKTFIKYQIYPRHLVISFVNKSQDITSSLV